VRCSKLTSSFHALSSCVHSVRQGADDTELRKQGNPLRALKFSGWSGQVGSHPRQRDLRGIRLKHDQVTLQLPERETALFTETPREG